MIASFWPVTREVVWASSVAFESVSPPRQSQSAEEWAVTSSLLCSAVSLTSDAPFSSAEFRRMISVRPRAIASARASASAPRASESVSPYAWARALVSASTSMVAPDSRAVAPMSTAVRLPLRPIRAPWPSASLASPSAPKPSASALAETSASTTVWASMSSVPPAVSVPPMMTTLVQSASARARTVTPEPRPVLSDDAVPPALLRVVALTDSVPVADSDEPLETDTVLLLTTVAYASALPSETNPIPSPVAVA